MSVNSSSSFDKHWDNSDEKAQMSTMISLSHDQAVVEMIKTDPEFANKYLAVALGLADQPGGQQALLAACVSSLRRTECLR